MRRVIKLVASMAIALALVACAHDGRTLQPVQSSPPPSSAPRNTVAAGSGSGDNAVIANASRGSSSAARSLLLVSSSFVDGATLPASITCDGASPSSPPLAWTGVPDGTAELALTVVDPDASGFVHWAVVGIAPSLRLFQAGAVPESVTLLTNDGGTTGWFGPCPPSGSTAHRYVFTLYALGQPSGIAAGSIGRDAVKALSAEAIESTTLVGTYRRA